MPILFTKPKAPTNAPANWEIYTLLYRKSTPVMSTDALKASTTPPHAKLADCSLKFWKVTSVACGDVTGARRTPGDLPCPSRTRMCKPSWASELTMKPLPVVESLLPVLTKMVTPPLLEPLKHVHVALFSLIYSVELM